MMSGSRVYAFGGPTAMNEAFTMPSVGRRPRAQLTPAPAEERKLRFFASSSAIPHPEKTGEGEDSCYISLCGRSLGVADGVGGWAEVGVDAGEYSREICDHATRLVKNTGELNPRRIMQHAFDESVATGTCTLCVLTLRDDFLLAANLGDSGFVVLRPTPEGLRFIARSEEQQHYFNCPKQLGTNSLDMPSDADSYQVKVEEGDIVIAGTDGFFDNLSVEDVISCVENLPFKLTTSEKTMTKTANHLATSAYMASRNKKLRTPFSKNAQAHGFDFTGGKMDDITVVLAVVALEAGAEAPTEAASPRHEPPQEAETSSPNPAHSFYLPPSVFSMEEDTDSEVSSNHRAASYYGVQTPVRGGEDDADLDFDAKTPDTVYSSCSSSSDASFDHQHDMDM